MPLMRRRQHRKRGEDEGMGTVMVIDESCVVILCFCVIVRKEEVKNEVYKKKKRHENVHLI